MCASFTSQLVSSATTLKRSPPPPNDSTLSPQTSHGPIHAHTFHALFLECGFSLIYFVRRFRPFYSLPFSNLEKSVKPQVTSVFHVGHTFFGIYIGCEQPLFWVSRASGGNRARKRAALAFATPPLAGETPKGESIVPYCPY